MPGARWDTAAGPRVLLLLGKPVHRTPVLQEAVRMLQADGAHVLARLPAREGLPVRLLLDADTVGVRGVPDPVLAAVADLEQRGARCCNSTTGTLTTRDRTAMQHRLEAAHIPVPRATTVPDVPAARSWAAGRPVVVKTRRPGRSRNGPDVVTWHDPTTGEPPVGAAPYLVQDHVPSDGIDRKLYAAGAFVGGLLKTPGPGRRPGRPFDVDPALVRLAHTVAHVFGLRIVGVDVVAGPDGPVVVDVNAFPGCAGVPGAAAAVARALLECARGSSNA